jgi:Spc7 kinetochore protein
MGRDTGVYTISESGEEVDVPKLSLEEFLEMAGVTFMDNMTAHRRSTMALQSSRDPNAGPRTFRFLEMPELDTDESLALQRPLQILPRLPRLSTRSWCITIR